MVTCCSFDTLFSSYFCIVFSEALTKDGQIYVYFFKNHLKKYNVPLSWEQARMQTQKELQFSQSR